MRNFEPDDSRPDLSGYVALAEQAEPDLFGRGQRAALDILESEHHNLLNALDEAYHTDRSSGIRISVAIWRFWLLRGYLAEGRARLALLLDANAGVSQQLKIRGLTVLGIIAFFQGDNVFAEQCARQSLMLAEQLEDEWGVAFSKTVLGWSAQAGADYDLAKALFQQSLTLFRKIGHRWGEAVSLLNLGEAARSQSDMDAAEQFYKEDLAIYRELNEQSAIAATLCNLGYVTLRRGDLPAARKYFRETMLLCQRLGNKQFAVGTFIGLAGVAAAEGDVERAAKLLGAADTLLVQIKGSLEPADVIERDSILESVQDRLGMDKFTVVWKEGKALTMDDVVELSFAEP